MAAHEVEPVTSTVSRITFHDRIVHRNVEHLYSCHQFVTVDEAGLIVLIVHEEIAGQPEALAAFRERVGL